MCHPNQSWHDYWEGIWDADAESHYGEYMVGYLSLCGNHYSGYEETSSDERNERYNDFCHTKVYPLYKVYEILLEKIEHDAEDQAKIEELEAALEDLQKEQEGIEKKALKEHKSLDKALN